MGQKTNPVGYRIGINKKTESIWFAKGQEYVDFFLEDLNVKKYLSNRLSSAMVSRIRIQRNIGSISIDLYTARPGQVIVKQGKEINSLRNELGVLLNKKRQIPLSVYINILEINKPWVESKLVGKEVSRQIKDRVSFRRAMKMSMRNAMRDGAQGIKIQCAGRLGGAEMARTERYQQGRTPLHTLRADIDYSLTECHTTYGIIGIKVWIYKGDIL